jgi:hypothetical protein
MALQLTKRNRILSCLITGVYDVNRNETLNNDDAAIFKSWYDSIIELNLSATLFHNNLSENTCRLYASDHIEFIKIEHNPIFKPNVFRYLVYHNYLTKYSNELDNIFVTDIADVVVVNSPFDTQFFKENSNKIFCGDEPKTLDNDWMRNHSAHLRAQIADYSVYEDEFKNQVLLNCGVIGGNIGIMSEFIMKLANIHLLYNFENKTAFTGDMGAFNYLIHTQFNNRFLHGYPINTEFKAYQINRKDCWFRHK